MATYLADYSKFKSWFANFSGSSEDLLHVHARLAIFFLAALLLRKRMRSPVPIALVLVFAATNEVLDWLADRPALAFEPVLDMANTVSGPPCCLHSPGAARQAANVPPNEAARNSPPLTMFSKGLLTSAGDGALAWSPGCA